MVSAHTFLLLNQKNKERYRTALHPVTVYKKDQPIRKWIGH